MRAGGGNLLLMNHQNGGIEISQGKLIQFFFYMSQAFLKFA
jgi:hypothetical protein